MPEVKRFELVPKDDVNRDSKVRALLSKDPVASRCLVYTYLKEPATVSEIVESIAETESIAFDRATIWRKLKLLSNLGLIIEIPISTVLNSDTNSKIHKEIKEKWREISKKHENNPVIYKKMLGMSFFVVTPKGENFLSWAIEKHNLPFNIRRIK